MRFRVIILFCSRQWRVGLVKQIFRIWPWSMAKVICLPCWFPAFSISTWIGLALESIVQQFFSMPSFLVSGYLPDSWKPVEQFIDAVSEPSALCAQAVSLGSKHVVVGSDTVTCNCPNFSPPSLAHKRQVYGQLLLVWNSCSFGCMSQIFEWL